MSKPILRGSLQEDPPAESEVRQETQSTAEAMVKVAEVLGQKMDRLTVRVDEGYGNDLQVVIDRMSDAITALSGRARREQSRLDA